MKRKPVTAWAVIGKDGKCEVVHLSLHWWRSNAVRTLRSDSLWCEARHRIVKLVEERRKR